MGKIFYVEGYRWNSTQNILPIHWNILFLYNVQILIAFWFKRSTAFLSVFGTEAILHCPDSKVHGANMGPNWVLPAPYGPHVGPMNLAITVVSLSWRRTVFFFFQARWTPATPWSDFIAMITTHGTPYQTWLQMLQLAAMRFKVQLSPRVLVSI